MIGRASEDERRTMYEGLKKVGHAAKDGSDATCKTHDAVGDAGHSALSNRPVRKEKEAVC